MDKVGAIRREWTDMSPYVVHFTKVAANQTAYEMQLSILGKRRIEARSKFGIGRKFEPCPKAVCLSETPLHLLSRLAEKRGSYGLGFRKEFIVEKDGGPVFYAYKGTPCHSALAKLLELAQHSPNDPLWRVAPFLEQPGQYGVAPYFFEWEREWRLPRDLHFATADVAFLIIPETLHAKARRFFDDAECNDLGPNYQCPYIDPVWDIKKVEAAMNP